MGCFLDDPCTWGLTQKANGSGRIAEPVLGGLAGNRTLVRETPNITFYVRIRCVPTG